jgi:hypothetical protein
MSGINALKLGNKLTMAVSLKRRASPGCALEKPTSL